jgi:hypothetical protein
MQCCSPSVRYSLEDHVKQYSAFQVQSFGVTILSRLSQKKAQDFTHFQKEVKSNWCKMCALKKMKPSPK